MTKRDVLKALEDMPMDAPIKVYSGAFYIDVDFVHLKNLWDCGKYVESICIETKV